MNKIIFFVIAFFCFESNKKIAALTNKSMNIDKPFRDINKETKIIIAELKIKIKIFLLFI